MNNYKKTQLDWVRIEETAHFIRSVNLGEICPKVCFEKMIVKLSYSKMTLMLTQ